MPSAFVRRTLLLAALSTASAPLLAKPAASTAEYRAQGEAQAAAHRAAPNHGDKAKDLIIFIGDGMGVSTITAGRIWQGQAAGQDGESTQTAMDSLDYAALVKTYSNDAQVSDSAPTVGLSCASAMRSRSVTVRIRSIVPARLAAHPGKGKRLGSGRNGAQKA